MVAVERFHEPHLPVPAAGSFQRAATQPNADVLALRVDGADLSLDHGYPARIIVPALPGVHNTKWVSGIAFLCLLVRLIDAPRPYASAQLGFYLAFLGSAALFAGTCWAIRDDTVPEGFEKAPRPELIHVD